MRRLSFVVPIGLLLISMAGCAQSAAVSAAKKPDFNALAREIDASKKAGDLGDGDVEDIAEAVAEGEIQRAKGVEGERMLETFGGCADEVEGALDDRYDAGDDTGAFAANILMNAGVVDIDNYVGFARETDARPAYRALGARGLVDEDDFPLRRKLFVDLDERVRVNALKAAMTAPAKEDFDLLIEAARVDPSRDARAAAAHAIGRIGGDRAVVALKDLWIRADAHLRDAIVDAYMSPGTYEAGGREQLVQAAESGGEGSIDAAVALSRVSLGEEVEKRAHSIAMGVLVRTIKLGTREDRTYAMLMAPMDDEVLAALRAAKDDSDAGVALIALGRLSEDGKDEKEKKAARDKLLTIAKSDDSEANRAMGELAKMGDHRVVGLLEKQLASDNAFARGYAARSLVLLGELPRAARALADKDSYVRASTACAILRKR
ncbi:MAG: hypothetical protein HOW73_10465 [Polyangiaceae bacterium]|nr:hypothetical protein [Polyangiaceae bacterium]